MAQDETPGLRQLFSRLLNVFRKPEAAASSADTQVPYASQSRIDFAGADPADLIRFAQTAPLVYGYWRDFKALYKFAETGSDRELLAALIGRLDTVAFPGNRRSTPALFDSSAIGPLIRIEISGNLAYVQAGDWSHPQAIYILDLTNPVEVARLHKFAPTHVTDFILNDPLVYILNNRTLSIFDVREARKPRLRSELRIENGTKLALCGNTLLIYSTTYRNDSLHVVDVSEPGQPRPLNTIKFSARTANQGAALNLINPIKMVTEGRYVYVLTQQHYSGGRDRLTILDLADPMNVRAVKILEVYNPCDLAIRGGYAFLLAAARGYGGNDRRCGLYVYALNEANENINPAQVAFIPLANPQSIAVEGNRAYVGVTTDYSREEETKGLFVFDITNPSEPQRLAVIPANSVPTVAVGTSFVYCGMGRSTYGPAELRAYDLSDPAKPMAVGTSPSRPTLGYMKRRARRALHTLAVSDPNAYAEVAADVLLQAGRGQQEVDRTRQWVSMDILYGSGWRYLQNGHGRGAYRIAHPRLSLKSREERYPELWDRHPGLAERLLNESELPWQTHEMAVKMLRSRKTALPTFSDANLARWLAFGSPLLRSLAARQIVAAAQTDKLPAADLTAETFYRGTAHHRRILQARVLAPETQKSWRNAFGTRLAKLACDEVSAGPLSRKEQAAFLLLAREFSSQFRKQASPELAIRLYAMRPEVFASWVQETLENLAPHLIPTWLAALVTLPHDLRDEAVQALRVGLRSKGFEAKHALEMVQSPSAWIRETGWRLLSVSATGLNAVVRVWETLLDATEATDSLRTALSSPEALSLFDQLRFTGEKLQELVETRPFLVPLLPVRVLMVIVRSLPAPKTVQLIQNASDEQWPPLRAATLSVLQSEPRQRTAFWQAAFEIIGGTDHPALIARLLNDPEMSASFLDVEEVTEFLKSGNPTFATILGAWARAHSERFTKDSPELLALATHMLPPLRDFGLERVREVGMSLPFALRLLESELPPSVAFGKTFFEGGNLDTPQQMERVLALCDSPKPAVRAYGRERATLLSDSLDKTLLFQRLSENPDTRTQEFAAKLTADLPSAETQDFDRAVLRNRDRGRRVKEQVKSRLAQQTTPDIALLLELARSRTTRDADWALGELAKLALSGVEIPGFTVEGAAG